MQDKTFDQTAQADGAAMANNQDVFLGVHTVNVKAQAQQMEDSVKVPVDVAQQSASVSDAMMAGAPNLAFDLPFHIQRFFGGKVPNKNADKGP